MAISSSSLAAFAPLNEAVVMIAIVVRLSERSCEQDDLHGKYSQSIQEDCKNLSSETGHQLQTYVVPPPQWVVRCAFGSVSHVQCSCVQSIYCSESQEESITFERVLLCWSECLSVLWLGERMNSDQTVQLHELYSASKTLDRLQGPPTTMRSGHEPLIHQNSSTGRWKSRKMTWIVGRQIDDNMHCR